MAYFWPSILSILLDVIFVINVNADIAKKRPGSAIIVNSESVCGKYKPNPLFTV
jgi:hypothetical protein